MNPDDTSNHSGLRDLPRDSEVVAEYYDNWAEDYDRTLGQWQYEAPEQVAARLRRELAPEAVILDAGCGTGLSGKALAAAGFATIDGMDVSARSLELAREHGVYRDLAHVDMQRLPLPYADDVYDGLVCVGVMTYLPDSADVLREFARVLKPGGCIVLTQRDHLFEERRFGETLAALEKEGVLSGSTISDPMPYLPENEEFGDEVQIHYVTCWSA
ncbi:class I SAM-dependent DNA methyltransferase [Halofilum ochraceum]|uniref:class I SAM-dependent DNA methyltransferase n=1 Tax=Halofilum ochraceum TaxID=1611323 RepID=UPI00158607F6|nr:class I SAM-dependent methyltransferase [Halofilum ochraceum]